ncbi:MAG TPA: hypothetical protein V6D07_05720 [Trichocoleus sp.]
MAPFNAADQQRTYWLYHYLCTCLAMKRKADGKPNCKGISDRISDRDLRGVVSALLTGENRDSEEVSSTRPVTTGRVATMLTRLRQTLNHEYWHHDISYTRVLTQEDTLTTLHYLTELTAQERQDLGLMSGDGLALLQRALLVLQTAGGLHNYEMLLKLYKGAVGLDLTQTEETLESLEQVDDLIERTVRQTLGYLPDRPRKPLGGGLVSPSRGDTVADLTLKAKREIRRLLARSGNQQSLVPSSTAVDSYIRHYLHQAFVVKLAQTVVNNERLTDQFPVYLKRITLEACGPLPFADKDLGRLHVGGPYPALLHPALRRLDQGNEGTDVLPGPGDYELASQEAARVMAEFYVKVPPGYQPAVGRVFQKLASEDQLRIDFSLDSTGIGGALSHVIKVINTALLSNISCLQEFFPIAHDVTCTQEIIRDNVPSPVWAHSLVQLCRKETVGETIQRCDRTRLRSYAEFAFADPIGHGDYCGFDFLLSQAQAALQARLQAIRNAGVEPQLYVRHLCQRTEYWLALQDAWSYLRGYPFSSLAMIGAIDEEILQPSVGVRSLIRGDSYLCFDACLSIVEALLDEGAYRSAYKFLSRLQVLEELVQQGLAVAQAEPQSPATGFEVFSGALIVRYLLCRANYYYLYDTSNTDLQYLPLGCGPDINREGLIQRSWQMLDQAQHHVTVRLRKYVVINEVSQGTFHPHYCLLARIAFLRAKMLLFFPRYVPRDDQFLPTERFTGQRRTTASIHWGRLYTAEMARLYAAADGDSEVYACYAALQCWLHLIAAYANREELTLSAVSSRDRTASDQTLAPEQCLQWAKRLRDHALISYAETGRRCYYQIKEKSGLPKQFDEFGRYCIQKLPAIYETRGEEYTQPNPKNPEFLVLDMSLLAVSPGELPKISPNHPTQSIYLFGVNACYLFFARGMYLLCSDVSCELESLENPTQPIAWAPKLQQAMRLLNMAWGTAEEGGRIEKDEENKKRKRYITRHFHHDGTDEEYIPPEVASVRDLYPRRVTEIADLGKVFAAACMVLQLPLASADDQANLYEDMSRLLSTLHRAHNLNSTERALLMRQPQYNGHIHSYLSQAKAILLQQAEVARTMTPPFDLKPYRDSLLKTLFAVLQG